MRVGEAELTPVLELEAGLVPVAVHSPVHVLHPEWSLFPDPGSNYDHVAAAASRRAILEHCAMTGHLLAPAHFQAPHACRIAHSADGRYLFSWATET